MDKIEVRRGVEANLKTKALYEQVFCEDTKNFIQYYYSEKSKDNKVYACEQRDEIVTMLHLNPYEVQYSKFFEKEILYYIVAVATKEEYRNKGYMKAVLTSALQDMYQEKKAFTFLMPAHKAIYEPYDFRYIYDRKQYALNNKILSKEILRKLICKEEKEKKIFSKIGEIAISVMNEELIVELSCVSNQILSKKYDVFCDHSKEYLERMQKELRAQDGAIFVVRKKGEIVGYFFYTEENSFIQEAEMIAELAMTTFFLEKEIKQPIIMARILCLNAIGKYILGKENKTIMIRIKDAVIAENNAIFAWHIKTTESTFVRKVEKNIVPELEMSIGQLTQIIFGYEEPSGCLVGIQCLKLPFLNEIV